MEGEMMGILEKIEQLSAEMPRREDAACAWLFGKSALQRFRDSCSSSGIACYREAGPKLCIDEAYGVPVRCYGWLPVDIVAQIIRPTPSDLYDFLRLLDSGDTEACMAVLIGVKGRD